MGLRESCILLANDIKCKRIRVNLVFIIDGLNEKHCSDESDSQKTIFTMSLPICRFRSTWKVNKGLCNNLHIFKQCNFFF